VLPQVALEALEEQVEQAGQKQLLEQKQALEQ
jgi:hypothetical protein